MKKDNRSELEVRLEEWVGVVREGKVGEER